MDPLSIDVRWTGPRRCRPLLLPLLVAAASSGLPAAGQTLEPAAPAATPQVVEAVTVTGTRRREPVRDVPVQLSTMPAEQLEQSGARTLTDYLATLPGVDLKTGGGPGLGTVTIRGISTGDPTVATVGIYVDDVPFGTSSAYAFPVALDMGLLDLSRIEILRGPQGTIYGASTMGGLIKYVTTDPDTTRYSGRAMVSFGSTQQGGTNNTVSAVLNAPLQDQTAGVRIAAFRDHFGGYVDATGPAAGSDVNSGDTVGGRASFLWTPTNRVRLKLTATSQNIKREGQDVVDYDAATGNPVNGPLNRQLAEREPYSVKIGVAGAELEYDMGWARLDSISSTQKFDLKTRTDVSYVYGPVLAGFGLDLDRVLSDAVVGVRRQVQELRLTSPRGVVEWLAGYFYNHEKATADKTIVSRLTQTGTPGPGLADSSIPSEYTENALFGDVTWNATDKVSLTGGMRGARNKQSFAQFSDGALLGGATTLQGNSDESTRTYLATARYALTPTSNVYARAANGYRPGGPNVVVRDPDSGDLLAPASFRSDSLWSYEAGYKADLLARALSVEAAVYNIKWKDLQQFSAVNGVNVIVNAGRAKVNGAELALRYRPTAQWTFDAAYTLIDAKLTEDAPGLGSSGARLPNSARNSISGGVTYAFEAGANKFQAGANVRHVGERNSGFEGSASLPNYRLPEYTLVDLRAAGDFGAVQVAFFVRNLLDKRAQLGVAANFVPLGGNVQVTPAQPRTIGLSVSGTF